MILKAERFRSVVSQLLLAYEAPSSSSSSSSVPSKHWLSGFLNDRCRDVVSVGKELFLVFDRETIRIHFQMSGSEILLKSGIPSPPPPKPYNKILTVVLKFEEYDVYIFDSHISARSLESFNAAQSLSLRDICLESFDFFSSLDLLQKDSRPIQETIMDQMIMPGVGNIIKCEGLFRAKVCPHDISLNIPREKLVYLISMLHSFARDWLLACRRRSKLEYQVYGKTQCPVCSKSIKLIRNSKGDGRITYYCLTCQASHLTSDPLSCAKIAKIGECDLGVIDLFIIPKCECTLSTIAPSLQRVRKSGVNHNRLFWCCGKRNRNKCNYFAWADARFPPCLHSHTSTIRRVLKTEGGNNGRYFFCCARQYDKCKYFQWVDRVPWNTSNSSAVQNNNDIGKVCNSAMKLSVSRKRTHSDLLSLQIGAHTTCVDENVLNVTNTSMPGVYSNALPNEPKKATFKFKSIPTCIQIPL